MRYTKGKFLRSFVVEGDKKNRYYDTELAVYQVLNYEILYASTRLRICGVLPIDKVTVKVYVVFQRSNAFDVCFVVAYAITECLLPKSK